LDNVEELKSESESGSSDECPIDKKVSRESDKPPGVAFKDFSFSSKMPSNDFDEKKQSST
jgi:hypothetical protein